MIIISYFVIDLFVGLCFCIIFYILWYILLFVWESEKKRHLLIFNNFIYIWFSTILVLSSNSSLNLYILLDTSDF